MIDLNVAHEKKKIKKIKNENEISFYKYLIIYTYHYIKNDISLSIYYYMFIMIFLEVFISHSIHHHFHNLLLIPKPYVLFASRTITKKPKLP